MKILIATDFYIHNLGGVTTSVLALCAGLRVQGHEVKILTLSDRHVSFRVGDEYCIRSFKAYYSPGVRFTVDFNDPLLKELEQWRPDIVHVHSEGTALTMAIRIARHCDVPLIMTAHINYAQFTFGKLKDLGPIKAFMTFVGGIVYKPAEKIVVLSQKALSFPFLSKFSDRLIVVPNGIEINKYQKKLTAEEKYEMRKQLGINDDEKILVTVTRLSKEKNIEELIDYFPALLEKAPDIKLLIVGDGPDRKHLEKLTGKHHLDEKVVFVGRQSAKDVWRYYDLADIFVSASIAEVHSMSYLEALALGLPFLCRADEALGDVVDHNYNGLIYFSREEFVEFACRMLKDDELRKKMGHKSLEKSKEFSAEHFALNIIRLYEEVIEESRSA